MQISTFGKNIGNSRFSVRCDVLVNDNNEAVQFQCYIHDTKSQKNSKAITFEDHEKSMAWMDSITVSKATEYLWNN